MTEANTLSNFNYGFSTHKSDILIHLSQWQYWWWFWFSLFWALYFFIILRVVNKNTFHFNPVINTSIRGHGKWGDFLVALIPLSWCGNILVNSNFILRMIEWQNESSLFTLRVQGKQWYWSYKFDASSAQSILSAPKNIGHNKWFVSTPFESYCADSYYQALQLGAQLEFQELYFKRLKEQKIKQENVNKFTKNYVYYQPSINIPNLSNLKINNHLDYLEITKFNVWPTPDKKFKEFYDFTPFSLQTLKKVLANVTNHKKIIGPVGLPLYKYFSSPKNWEMLTQIYKKKEVPTKPVFLENIDIYKMMMKSYSTRPTQKSYLNNILDDTVKYSANALDSVKVVPFAFIKGTLNKHNLDVLVNSDQPISKNIFLTTKFFLENGALEPKSKKAELFWGFKQKKYKRIQKFKFKEKVYYDSVTLQPAPSSPKNSAFTFKSNLLTPLNPIENPDAVFDYHRSIKYNRHRGELVPVNLARRLLRTKRTLVLPAHVNITVITNSYDVVHSWFIPGLGLKLDCVPGRSTHHTFYIDNIGFYYGQCAEICGRYHHHMPIRLCALPFEQFLVWWQRRGVKRLHRVRIMNDDKTIDKNQIKFKYNW